MKSNNHITVILTNENFEKGFLRLRRSGVNLLHFPMIKTSSRKQNSNIDLKDKECIIFTSKNGVKYFFTDSLAKEVKMDEKFFVCIGKKTAQKLKEFGFKASYVCKRNYSKFMSDEIKKSGVLKDKKSLLVQGSLSDNSLLNSLISFSNTQKAIFYNTELLNKKYDDLEKICQK